MKQYTQSELQKMYMEPSEELKDRIHQEISSLPIKEQEENIVKKKQSTVKTRMRSARKQLSKTLLVEWEAES